MPIWASADSHKIIITGKTVKSKKSCYGDDNQGKVADRKKVCSLSFFVYSKSSGVTGKYGQSSGERARHDHARDVQYRQIQR